MIVVALDGGVGNQLFQYAAARALALRLGVPVGLDTRWYAGRGRRYALDRFKISTEPVDPAMLPFRDGKILGRLLSGRGGRLQVYREKGLAFDPAVPALGDGTYLRGVFQSERYFADEQSAIRRDLAFIDPPDAENRAVLTEIGKAQRSVSLHVRRGDYVANPKIASVHGTVSLDYYARALALVAARIEADPLVFVFSDDPAWAADNLQLGVPTRILGHNGDARAIEDLRLMAACRHHILANSSFSWWGAWLDPSPDKIVVAPEPWFRTLDGSTIVPDRWIRLPTDGAGDR